MEVEETMPRHEQDEISQDLWRQLKKRAQDYAELEEPARSPETAIVSAPPPYRDFELLQGGLGI